MRRARVGAVLLARLDSQRLPGKVLRHLGGVPMIEFLLDRVERASELDAIVLATSNRKADDPLVEAVSHRKLLLTRGSMADVVSRLLAAAEAYDLEYVARVNVDSPFTDPTLLDAGVRLARDKDGDLVTNLVPRTYPYGISVEIIRVSTLRRVWPALGVEAREHVTSHFYIHADRYKMTLMALSEYPFGNARLTVDTEDDLLTLNAVVERLGKAANEASWRDVAEAYLEGPMAGGARA